MQADFEQYGVDAFTFEILEECAPKELDKREGFFLNELQPEYNIKTDGQGISDEAREKLRELHTGKKRPEISRKVKCVETSEIFQTLREAAEHVKISNAAISHTLHGRTNTAGGYHREFVTA